MKHGIGQVVVIGPLLPAWTPAKIDIFTDFGSLLHVAFGVFVSTLPPAGAIGAMALFQGYESTKSASGESWERIGGTWVEFAIGIGLGLLVLVGGRRR